MYRKSSVVHLVSLIAIIIGLFSPILGLPVVAEEPLPDTEAAATPISESRQLIPVTPEMPTLSEAAREDGAMYAEVAAEVPTEGVVYSISVPDAEGAYLVTATLADASIYTWSESGMDGWTVEGTTASSGGAVALCPPAEEAVDSEESSESDAVDDGEDETTEDLAEPTTGRGPARDTGTMQAMGINATGTELEIAKSASKTSDVAGGDEIVYTTSVANNTGADHHYSLTDVLPAGVTYQSHTVPYPADGDKCTESAGTVTCGLAEGMVLYPGWTDVWTITVLVNDDAANANTCETDLVNTVSGDWGGSASTFSSFSEAACKPELSIMLTADSPEYTRIDQEIALTVTITNTSTVAATYVTFVMNPETFYLPDPWQIYESNESGSCEQMATILCQGFTIPGRVGDTPGVETVRFVQANNSPPFCWTAEFITFLMLASWSGPQIATETLKITCKPMFEVEIAPDKTVMTSDERVAYTISVTNVGLQDFTLDPGVSPLAFQCRVHLAPDLDRFLARERNQ